MDGRLADLMNISDDNCLNRLQAFAGSAAGRSSFAGPAKRSGTPSRIEAFYVFSGR